MVRTDMAGSGIKIHTGGRAFNTVSSIYLKILKINHLTAHNFPNLGGLACDPRQPRRVFNSAHKLLGRDCIRLVDRGWPTKKTRKHCSSPASDGTGTTRMLAS